MTDRDIAAMRKRIAAHTLALAQTMEELNVTLAKAIASLRELRAKLEQMEESS